MIVYVFQKYPENTRTAMNAKTSVFVICGKEIISSLLYNLDDCKEKSISYDISL